MKYLNEMMKEWAREDRKEMKLSYPATLEPHLFDYHKRVYEINPTNAVHLPQRLNGMFGFNVRVVINGRKFVGRLMRDRIKSEPMNAPMGNGIDHRKSRVVNRDASKWVRNVGLIVTQAGTGKCRRFSYDDIAAIRLYELPDGTSRMEIKCDE